MTGGTARRGGFRAVAWLLTTVLCAIPMLAACGGRADISAYGDTPIEISGLTDEDFTITPGDLAALPQVSRSATGGTAKAGTVRASGPLLDTFLKQYGKSRADFSRIRFIARDGYRVVLRGEYLTDYEVVLSVASGAEPLPEAERPLRVLIPEAESNMWEYACVRIEFVPSDGERAAESGDTRVFTDSADRRTRLPRVIDRVAPSGAYAQIMLCTLCPEKLIGLSAPFSRRQKTYIDEAYQTLPVFGQFYGKNATMNFEEIIKAAPDLILDIGEEKDGIASDMDGIAEQTGIPVVFVEATLASLPDAYETLGELLGVPERGRTLAAYVRRVLAMAAENGARVPDAERTRVLYGDGEYGLEVAGAGSVHAEVVEAVGAVNVAVLDRLAGAGRNEVSIERVLEWDPDVIILAPDSCYADIFDDPVWAGVRAVRNGAVYEIPAEPYNWLDRPPSAQRALGVLWLGRLLYPELYDIDIVRETQAFYKLFWNYDLTEKEAAALLANAGGTAGGGAR